MSSLRWPTSGGGGGHPTGPAGGVLAGTYPDPDFAADMATQAELDAGLVATLATVAAGYQPLDADLTAIAALTTTTFGRALLTQADAAATRTALGLGTAATQNVGAFDASGAAAAAQAASQPLDSDLTAIAALTTTTFGRALLTLADAAAGRTALGLGTAATQNVGAFDASGAAAAAQAASQPLDSDLTAIAALSTATFGRNRLTDPDAATARTALGVGPNLLAVNSQTGTTYTLALTDQDLLVSMSNAASITCTIPANGTVAFPIGTQVHLGQAGAGQVTVAAAGGVTLIATPGAKLRAQYSMATAIKTATNGWWLIGDLSA